MDIWVGDTLSNSTANSLVQCIWRQVLSFLCSMCLGGEMLGHMALLCLFEKLPDRFQSSCTNFLPTSKAPESPAPRQHLSLCILISVTLRVWCGAVLCFWSVFPWKPPHPVWSRQNWIHPEPLRVGNRGRKQRARILVETQPPIAYGITVPASWPSPLTNGHSSPLPLLSEYTVAPLAPWRTLWTPMSMNP